MKRYLLFVFMLLLMIAPIISCKSKKQCADFSDPKRNYKADYNKKGLIKKKGYKKPTWDNN